MLQTKDYQLKKVIEVCSSYNNDASKIINIITDLNNHFGNLTQLIKECIASCLDIPVNKVSEIDKFHLLFNSVPNKKHYSVTICTDTACCARGALTLVEELTAFLKSKGANNKFTIHTSHCIGACGLAPVVKIENKLYKYANSKIIKEILNSYNK